MKQKKKIKKYGKNMEKIIKPKDLVYKTDMYTISNKLK